MSDNPYIKPQKDQQSTEKPPNSSNGGWWMIAIGWALLLSLATLIFQGFLDSKQNPNRLAVMRDGALELRPGPRGQYYIDGYINGYGVTFLLDTGATIIAVPERIASLAGLRAGASGIASTAAGRVEMHSTRMEQVEFGGFILSDLAAAIVPSDNPVVLLGMNALKHFDMSQEDGYFVLRKRGEAR